MFSRNIFAFALLALFCGRIGAAAVPVPVRDSESSQCKYIVQTGDTLIKIANLLESYLPIQYKQCMKCPGFKEACVYPESQCPKCGHKGDYIALWKANGACKNGFLDADKIKVGQVLQIPNCPPKPTSKPTPKPVKKSTVTAVPTAPATDDEVDHFFNGVHKVAKTIVKALKSSPSPKPSKAKRAKPTKKPTPAPVPSDGEYYAEESDVKTYYAAA